MNYWNSLSIPESPFCDIHYSSLIRFEGIITQKYISYAFQNGLESYSEYRRTGYPVLTDYSNNSINLTNFPNRLTYPAKEASLNGSNYNQAIIQQGPDIPTTKVWWDVN